MAKPSFQDVFKLMNSIVEFEQLLDATNLEPETCVNLGIHEKFKQLYEKIGKYVQHEETKDLTFKSICNICCNEIKILNCDIRTSVAIHNAGELHRVAAKMMDITEHDRDVGGEPVQQPIDLKNIANDNVLKQVSEFNYSTAENMGIKVDDKQQNLDLETKSVPYLINLKSIPKELFKPTGELPSNDRAKSVDGMFETQESDDWNTIPVAQLIDFNNVPSKTNEPCVEVTNNVAAENVGTKGNSNPLNLETKSESQFLDLSLIPNELLKPTSKTNSVSQNKGFVSNNLNANVSSPCTTCQQVFCICGFKNKNMQVLSEKMSNIDLSQQGGTYSVPTQLLGNYSMFSGGIQPRGIKVLHSTTTTIKGIKVTKPSQQKPSQMNKKPEEKRSAKTTPIKSGTQPHGGKPAAQSHTNKKPLEKKSKSKPVFVKSNPAQQYLNVHVHMPPSGGQSVKAFMLPTTAPPPPLSISKPVRPQDQFNKKSVEENLELLRSKTLEHQEEMQLMYKMLKQAERGHWKRNHFTKIRDHEQNRYEYICNVCNTGSRMSCSLHVVQHARGRSHQEVLLSNDQRSENVRLERRDNEEPCVVS